MYLWKREDEFDREMKEAALKNGLPFPLLKAMVAKESGFHAEAERYEAHIDDSSYGLTQILYKNAQRLGFKGPKEGLKDPATNLFYGAKFLKGVLGGSKFAKPYPNRSYSLVEGIAAYNMGWPRPIEATTSFIAKIYGYPMAYKTDPPAGWQLANQPYVDRVLAYAVFYDAKEKGDEETMKTVKNLIQRRSYRRVYSALPGSLLYDRPGSIAVTRWAVGRVYPEGKGPGPAKIGTLALVALVVVGGLIYSAT